MRRILFYYSLMAAFLLSSCNGGLDDEGIPFAFVNQELNLNLIQYQDLKNPGGYIYIEKGINAGVKGLIVYHEGNDIYRAFDRACTYDPYSTCEPVTVDDSGLFMIHSCCNSTFNFNGNPTSGPASLNLMQYTTYLDGIYLKIINN